MNALAGKVIVIVGGTTGLGLSAAHACAQAGARLILVGRDAAHADEAVRAIGSEQARAVVGDAALPATSEQAVAAAVETFGRLDGLYHVAGGSGRRFGDGPLDQITDEGWQATLRWNLDSLFYSNRAAVRQLLQQEGGGSILNMSSVLADSPAPHFFSTHAYATSKAAIIGLTKASAAYYAPRGVRFNVLAPGLVETPMSLRAQEDDAIMGYIATKQPLDGGRIGSPADLDAAVVYFLSDAAKFVTGQVLKIDGGWSVTEGRAP